MALKIFEKFSPRANPADSNYPYGSIKNESVPGAKDGTPLDASWGNDMGGFTDALLADAGIVPSGTADTAVSSQRLDALKKVSSLQAAIQLIEQWGCTYKGTFAKGFTYSQVGDAGVDSDFKAWIYVGAGAPDKIVTAGTVPSSPDYEQVTFNSASGVIDSSGSSVQDFIDTSKAQGIIPWDADTTYPVDGLAKGSDGNVYKAVSEQLGNDPVGDSGSNWINWLSSAISNNTNSVIAESFGQLRDTQTMQSAVDYANANGYKYITVNDDWNVGEIEGKGNVIFIGKGSISGVYRKYVSNNELDSPPSYSDLVPSQHMQRFLSESNPVVVMVGDSLGTDDGGNIPQSSTLYAKIKAKLSSAYPNKNITFYNRSIGGETYFTALGTPFSFPSWFTDTERGWPRYVGDLNPDLVIFNFGMNDSSDLQSSTLATYQTYLDNVGIFPAGRPDLIYCTNLTPSIDSKIGDFGTEAGQSGRDFVAGYTRTYAKANGYGLMDMHRLCTIVKDGYDPTNTELKAQGSITPSSGAVAGNVQCTDFKWELTTTLAVGTNMAVKLGAAEQSDASGRGAFVVVSNTGGFLTADFHATPSDFYESVVTTVSVPAGSFTLTVEKKQNSVSILINNIEAVYFGGVRCAGRDFIPRAGDATYVSGNITAANFWSGEYKKYRQTLTNNDMWGAPSLTTETRTPWGGNGVNHPTTIGGAAIYQPVIDSSAFGYSLPGVLTQSSELVTFVNGWSKEPGFSDCIVSRVGNICTISFTIQPPAPGSQGIAFTVPLQYRPKPALVSNCVITNPGDTDRIGQIKPNGDFEVFGSVTGYCFGQIIYPVDPV